MPVYKFSHQLLAILVHLAHTAVKWKTNFHPKSLLRRTKSRSLVPLVAVVDRTANTKSAVDDFVK